MDWKESLWPEWKIVSLLGEGAYGKVYKIERHDIGGTYYAALKVVSFPRDEEEKELFRRTEQEKQKWTQHYHNCAETLAREFSVMERLKGNTNIVSYEDHKLVPHKNGIGYDVLIRMELLETLPEYLARTKCDEKLATKLGIDICNALILCEKEKIIHCDVKPGNIFVSNYGDFKLGDFSIAHIVDQLKKEQGALGTYQYIAPEVCQGKGFNPTVDTYALGLIMYRILNKGMGPFLALPPEKLTVKDVEYANMRRLNGEEFNKPIHASMGMTGIIFKACSYRKEERYSSALKMKKALERSSIFQIPAYIVNYITKADESKSADVEEISVDIDEEIKEEKDKAGIEEFFEPAGEL